MIGLTRRPQRQAAPGRPRPAAKGQPGKSRRRGAKPQVPGGLGRWVFARLGLWWD